MSVPQQYAVLLKDNNGVLVNYIDNKVTNLSWEWNRIGGCGACDLTLRESWDSVLAGSFQEDYEVNIYAPAGAGTSVLWYSGYIDRVSPQASGDREDVRISCLGFVNQLKRVIVSEKTYTGYEIANMAKDIIDTYVAPETKIYGNNLLSNGNFGAWTSGTNVAPDGWTASFNGTNGAVAQELTTVKIGSYAVGVVSDTNVGNYSFIAQNIHTTKGIDYWKGRKVTFGCWVNSAQNVSVIVGDGTAETSSGYYGGSGWKFVTATRTISTSATVVRAKLYIDLSATAYFDGAIMSEGGKVRETDASSFVSDYDETGFSADSLYFNESAYDALVKIADIAGLREWGVRADKTFFFLKRNDAVTRYMNITEDFVDFSPERDFGPMITGIYLEGGEGYKARFLVTNRIALREEVVSNSSITTQSVGQQYARMYLKDKSRRRLSYSVNFIKKNTRFESTIPMGKAAVNLKVPTTNKYDTSGVIYDAGYKYNGGLETFQIETIKYTLTDDGINADLTFNFVPPNIVDEMKKLEFMITSERNI